MSKATGDEMEDSVWNHCPTEILWIIMKELDPKTLFTCMHVNKKWKAVACDLAECYGLWQKLAEDMMDNNGATFRRKSKLNWRDIFLNYLLWYKMDNAQVSLIHTYKIQDVKNLYVYKDKLIVTDCIGVKYYNIENFEQTKAFQTFCIKFEESDDIIAKLVDAEPFPKLCLSGKTDPDDFNLSEHYQQVFNDILFYKLEDDHCYAINNKNIMLGYKQEGRYWRLHTIARYYGDEDSVCSMRVYHDEIYFLLRTGEIMKSVSRRMSFEKDFRMIIPKYKTDVRPVMFHKFSAVFGVPWNRPFRMNVFKDKNDMDHIVLECPGLSCATEHGDILFLGYKDGTVEVTIPYNLLINGGKAELILNVRQFNSSIKDPKITAINVYEAKNCHHLFIVADTFIFQVLISHLEGSLNLG